LLRKYGYSKSGLNFKFDPKAQVLEKKVPENTSQTQSFKNFKEYEDAKEEDIIITIEHW